MRELYGGREAVICGAFQKEQESAGIERSRISRGFWNLKQHKDCGTSERILGWLTVGASWNSIFMQQSCIVLPSTLALPFRIVLVFLLVSAALLQGTYSHTEKHMRGQRMRHKIASREGRASSVLAPRPLEGSPCFREIGRGWSLRWGWVFLERTRILGGIQFTTHFINFFVVETKRSVSSTVNVVLTLRTCGLRTSRAMDRKCRVIKNYSSFSKRICHTFLILNCRGDWDLGWCTFWVLAKENRCAMATSKKIVARWKNQNLAFCNSFFSATPTVMDDN